MRRFLLLFVLVFVCLNGFTQYKYEKEFGIGKKDVPENALRFIDSLQLGSRIKWYKEIGYQKTSYEAKSKYKGKKISIEFSDDGSFEDVEIEIKAKEIGNNPKTAISQYLTAQLGKYTIEKVQIQYSGNPECIFAFFKERKTSNCIVTHFEIVVSAKVDGSFALFEYLFTQTGDFVNKSQIPKKMNDNIEY